MSIFLQNYVQLLQGARINPLQPVVSGGFRLLEGGEFAILVLVLIFRPTGLLGKPALEKV